MFQGIKEKINDVLYSFEETKLFSFIKRNIKGILSSLTFLSFTILFSWKFSLFLMFAILWHELGHYLCLKLIKHPTFGIFFIPLMGGMTIPAKGFETYEDNCLVALAGPLAGFLQTIILLVIYSFTGMTELACFAGFTAFLNLFNLIPLSLFDGGQVMRAIAYSINPFLGKGLTILSFALILFFSFKASLLLFFIFALMAILDLLFDLVWRKKYNIKRPQLMNWKHSLFFFINWLILSAALVYLFKLSCSIPNAFITNIFKIL